MKKENFDILIHNLRNQDNLGTADPVYTVQEKVCVYGFEDGYEDGWKWCGKEQVFDTTQELLDWLIENEYLTDKEVKEAEEFEIDLLLQQHEYNQIGIKHYWKHVNTHLTREAAEAFIKRKQHDYGELRIWVDSLYWCYEFKDIVNALRDGKLVLKEEQE